MKFSAKTQATMQVLATLAQQSAQQPLGRAELAQLCGLSQESTQAILTECQHWGLVHQVHEAYQLAYSPADITFLCIASMTEHRDELCSCDGKSEDSCHQSACCPTRRIRNIAQIALDDALESISLYDVMKMK